MYMKDDVGCVCWNASKNPVKVRKGNVLERIGTVCALSHDAVDAGECWGKMSVRQACVGVSKRTRAGG